AAERTSGQDELVTNTAQDSTVGQVLQIQLRKHQVQRQLPIAHGTHESGSHEVFRPGIRGGQKEQPPTRGYSGLCRFIERTHTFTHPHSGPSIRQAHEYPRPTTRRTRAPGTYPELPSSPAPAESAPRRSSTRQIRAPSPHSQ